MASWKDPLGGYKPVSTSSDNTQHGTDEEQKSLETSTPGRLGRMPLAIIYAVGIACLVVGFFAGSVFATLAGAYVRDSLEGVAPRVPLATVKRSFNYSTAFSDPPPQGEGAQNTSEPVWDSLIPRGLGYFKDESLTSEISIPTVFHSLHCLYVLRRAYYAESEELGRFDLGKDRATHVPHCFDYLQQTLTCSADSTAEPAVDHEHGFLGSGFERQCRDFEGLKRWVEERRVFNATGFLAEGLHGHAVGE